MNLEAEEGSEVRSTPQRILLPPSELDITKDQLVKLWQSQDNYIDQLEARLAEVVDKEDKDKNKPVVADSSRRENLLVMRLTAKEQELQEMAGQIAELKAAQAPNTQQLRSALLDPAVNLIIQKLKKECDSLRKQMEEAQNELSAWKFTPDSATGKRLMAKCRQLYQENEDLGKMIASGRLAKLEGELALQKNLTEEMKKNQLEMDEFMAEMEEECEGMQSTIYYLQQQLKEAKEKISKLEANNASEKGNTETKEDVKAEKLDESKDSSGQRLSLDWSGSVEDNIGVKEEEDEEDRDNIDAEIEAKEDKLAEDSDKNSVKDNEEKIEKKQSGRTESPSGKREVESPISAKGDSPGGKRGRGRGRRRAQEKSEDNEEDEGGKSGRGKRKRPGVGGRTGSKRTRRTESECSDAQNEESAE